MNLHTLLTKHQIIHGLENDQANIDAFVKELTRVIADVVGSNDTDMIILPIQHEAWGVAIIRDQLRAEIKSAIKLMGEK